jgi:major type 1 subunit fimbrin (pilin)
MDIYSIARTHPRETDDTAAPLRPVSHARNLARRIAIVITVCMALLGQRAWATGCVTINGYPKTFTIALGASSIMVPRDVAVGSVIYSVDGPVLAADSTSSQCNDPYGTVNGVVSSAPWPQVSPGLYSTNISGVGIRVTRYSRIFPFSYPYTPADFKIAGAPYYWYFSSGPIVTYVFVKTGPISGGIVTAADIPLVQMNLDSTDTEFTTMGSGQVTFTVGACITPDVQVLLDTVPVTAFAGVGSTAGAKPFNIAVNSCPPGLNTVRYQLDAASGIAVVDASRGVLGLDGAASASGVGVQVRDASNNPVPLGSMRATSGYNSSAGGSFTIPLKAMYYQVASSIRGGSVASQAVLTMSYQ